MDMTFKKMATLLFVSSNLAVSPVFAEQTIQLSTINWQPYTGESLLNHGFISELVTEAFARVDYRVEFKYMPWARALVEAKKGIVHGVMDAYWKEDRVAYLEYPNVIWKVKEEFISLKDNQMAYSGSTDSLIGYSIGALRGSAQAQELIEAGVSIEENNSQAQNVKMLIHGRVDSIVIPRNMFFYHATSMDPDFDSADIEVIKPAYKTYDMYVAFSKKKPNYKQLTLDFNKGLSIIKSDGTYHAILKKHHILVDAVESH